MAVFGAEGYLAETYRKTQVGREEERKAKAEGAALYRHCREHLLRPGVLGGLVGICKCLCTYTRDTCILMDSKVNVGVLGGLGYVAYIHRDLPHCDRRTVSAISVSLLTLWVGEG